MTSHLNLETKFFCLIEKAHDALRMAETFNRSGDHDCEADELHVAETLRNQARLILENSPRIQRLVGA